MINQFIVCGRLTHEPCILDEDYNLISLSLKQDDDFQVLDIFIDLSIASHLVLYCKKNDLVLVKGHFKSERCLVDGKYKNYVDLVADHVVLLESFKYVGKVGNFYEKKTN